MRAFPYFSVIVVALQSTASAQDNTKQLQDRWTKCVEETYKLNRKMNPKDQDIAIKLAFEHCAPEEEELRARISQSDVSRSYVDQLKAKIERSILR